MGGRAGGVGVGVRVKNLTFSRRRRLQNHAAVDNCIAYRSTGLFRCCCVYRGRRCTFLYLLNVNLTRDT